MASGALICCGVMSGYLFQHVSFPPSLTKFMYFFKIKYIEDIITALTLKVLKKSFLWFMSGQSENYNIKRSIRMIYRYVYTKVYSKADGNPISDVCLRKKQRICFDDILIQTFPLLNLDKTLSGRLICIWSEVPGL